MDIARTLVMTKILPVRFPSKILIYERIATTYDNAERIRNIA